MRRGGGPCLPLIKVERPIEDNIFVCLHEKEISQRGGVTEKVSRSFLVVGHCKKSFPNVVIVMLHFSLARAGCRVIFFHPSGIKED